MRLPSWTASFVLGSSRRRANLLAAVWVVLLGVTSCVAEPDEDIGGETHFLRVCQPDDGSCGSQLSCLCGVCSLPCDAQATCSGFAAAQCTTPTSGSCGTSEPPRLCGVTCSRDQDCTIVSPAHRCEAGLCLSDAQLPSNGGEGGSGPEASGGSTSASGGAAGCDVTDISANDIAILGDSFFAAGHQLTAYLEDEARKAGLLEAGERYRDYSRLTGNALALSGNGIAAQYAGATDEAPVRVAIMNGGGADILLGNCDVVDAECPLLTAAEAAFRELLVTMSNDAVSHVVFVGYPDPVPTAASAKMDTLRPMLEAVCAGSEVPCLWVDLRPAFADHYADYVQSDGLNPTDAGAEVAAQVISEAMAENCVPR